MHTTPVHMTYTNVSNHKNVDSTLDGAKTLELH